ncbi:hypothetical protein ACQ4PT_037634 [Festuca glaucescens]
MHAFLRDGDPRRRVVADEVTRVWLHQTRDAAFDAEDAVDQYFLQVDLSRDNLLQPPLVRREEKRKEFDAALRNGTDRPVVISVIGQSGVGKSTLFIHSVFTLLQIEDDVARGHCRQ